MMKDWSIRYLVVRREADGDWEDACLYPSQKPGFTTFKDAMQMRTELIAAQNELGVSANFDIRPIAVHDAYGELNIGMIDGDTDDDE